MKRLSKVFKIICLTSSYTFLYLPILLLIIYSFNDSKLVTVWGGFSTRWYSSMLENRQLLDSLYVSVKIAFWTANAALVIGTLSGYILQRFKVFRGRSLFFGMITAPLVIPEVITGISLLLLFVAMESYLGWPAGRGLLTIWIAHTTFCSAFVAVVIGGRLKEMDNNVEEASLDMGCPPVKTFFVIVLPIIVPALISSWLLAFTLSFDDLVIASFVSGPGSTTLPMRVYSSVRLGVNPEINAIATIIVVGVLCLSFLALFLNMRKTTKY